MDVFSSANYCESDARDSRHSAAPQRYSRTRVAVNSPKPAPIQERSQLVAKVRLALISAAAKEPPYKTQRRMQIPRRMAARDDNE